MKKRNEGVISLDEYKIGTAQIKGTVKCEKCGNYDDESYKVVIIKGDKRQERNLCKACTQKAVKMVETRRAEKSDPTVPVVSLNESEKKTEEVNTMDHNINKYQNLSVDNNNSPDPDDSIPGNGIEILLKLIAFLILVAGVVCGFIFGNDEFIYAVIWWGPTLITFGLLFGLGEVINLLNKIYYSNKK